MNNWTAELLDDLAGQRHWSYSPGCQPASEPTALAALALLAHGRVGEGHRALRWLAKQQAADGSLGVTADQPAPRWPTGLAILAWDAARRIDVATGEEFAINLGRALPWVLHFRGETMQQESTVGHDTTLVGWPWVEGTHSWIEPTAWNVLALKKAGLPQHARTREAVRLLRNRILPDGGANYGNTIVLGQQLRPHVQPTGLVLLALADEPSPHEPMQRSASYLRQELSKSTATASLCYGLLGLTAWRAAPPEADTWLEASYRRHQAGKPSGLKLALLALAALGERCPLVLRSDSRRTSNSENELRNPNLGFLSEPNQ